MAVDNGAIQNDPDNLHLYIGSFVDGSEAQVGQSFVGDEFIRVIVAFKKESDPVCPVT